jgi:hypothetical protein
VVAALVGALRNEVNAHADTVGRHDRSELADVAVAVQQVASQLPVLADRLITAVDRWSRTGQLYANARDLPPVEDMPEDRVKAVIAGRQVQARGADLDRLRLVVGRAADLSTGLADALDRPGVGPPAQRHLADLHARNVHVPGVAERLLGHAQAVAGDSAATRPPPPVGPLRSGPGHLGR